MKQTVSLFLTYQDQLILAVRNQGQHYHGLFQATTHGEIEEGESIREAMERELEQETNLTFSVISDLQELGKKIVGARKPEECHYFTAQIDSEAYHLIEPGDEVERFDLITSEELSKMKKFSDIKEDISDGVDENEVQVMFDDELEVARQILASGN